MTEETTTIGHGSDVVMYFSITLEDGTVAETTEEGDPLHFRMGDEPWWKVWSWLYLV